MKTVITASGKGGTGKTLQEFDPLSEVLVSSGQLWHTIRKNRLS